ncbi:hypothetical protein Nepgr_005855 [Nepenthes gracilis]|uniref:Homeobox domain-containing protein n=1 Tax=Nepenthes gracilis TaxID=150966 RepID=A0AAD3S442_NEPGR|nr:hypothetical protein Nepgr_005855 [Nepenthes gracilis]
MKVHRFARALWDHQHQYEPSLTLGCKRMRPLTTKLPGSSGDSSTSDDEHVAASLFDLKSFIRPNCGPRKLPSNSIHEKNDPSPAQVGSHQGGTRWNPTQEQVGILEMLYRGGMRTPNAQQIEQITALLTNYGKIEGKNVFYWFQNHKARERQRQKRDTLTLTTHTSASTALSAAALTLNLGIQEEVETEGQNPYKRKCRSWRFEELDDNSSQLDDSKEEGDLDKTLELFPLHPEGR